MKPRLSSRPEAALTLLETSVVVAVELVLVATLLAVLTSGTRKVKTLTCSDHLRQIGMAYRSWEGDHGGRYPTGLSMTNGGAMERSQMGDAVATFQVMSNELSTAVKLWCPADARRYESRRFPDLRNLNVSYFVGVDATNPSNPRMILAGDCNLGVGGKRVKPGLVWLRTNQPVTWGATRHVGCGNLGLNDGSVQAASAKELCVYFERTGLATNRLAIP